MVCESGLAHNGRWLVRGIQQAVTAVNPGQVGNDKITFLAGRLVGFFNAGVGGVSSAEDAYAKIRSGASLVQVYSALVYEGACGGREVLLGARGLHATSFRPRCIRRRDEAAPLPFLGVLA
jgi:hypothetical protein